MESPGGKNMALGALLFLGGGSLTLLGAASGGTFIVFGGAILGGAVMFLIGVMQASSAKSERGPANPFQEEEIDVVAMIRTLIAAVDRTDGLDDKRLAIMQAAFRQILGREVETGKLLEAWKALSKKGEDITSFLSRSEHRLTPEYKRIVLAMAGAVMLSSGQSLTEPQGEFFTYLSRSLQLGDGERQANFNTGARFAAQALQPAEARA